MLMRGSMKKKSLCVINVLFSSWLSFSSALVREYFSVVESPQEDCWTSCESIGGLCNEERIAELALNVDQCQNAVISFVEWSNSPPVGRYALYPGSGVNSSASGGCVARNIGNLDGANSSLIQIQTRISPNTTVPNLTTAPFIGYNCAEFNPDHGNWSRLCPCIVNISTTDMPSMSPSAAPSLWTSLNTVYLNGSSLSQLKASCGISNFIEIFRTTLIAVYDLEKNNVGEISVFEINVAGYEHRSTNRVIGVSFYIVFRSQSPLVASDFDSKIKSPIENNVLLDVLESLGNLNNCTFADNVVVIGMNEDIDLFHESSSSDIYYLCHNLLSDNITSWNYLFRKATYGIWLVCLLLIYCCLIVVFGTVVVGQHSSCLVYGTANSAKFKYLWSFVFSLLLLKLLYFAIIISSWGQESFACAERFFVTSSPISDDSLNLMQLSFVPIAVCIIAGLLYVDLGLDLSYSTISSGMSCLAFGPFIWFYFILYVILAFVSSAILPPHTSETERGHVEPESHSFTNKGYKEISKNILGILFGLIIVCVCFIWILDIVRDRGMCRSRRRNMALLLAMSGGIYGGLIVLSSLPFIYTSPVLFFTINALVVRVAEILLVLGCMLYLLNEMKAPSGTPASTSALRQGYGKDRPISYPRGSRGVSFDPLWSSNSMSATPLSCNSRRCSSAFSNNGSPASKPLDSRNFEESVQNSFRMGNSLVFSNNVRDNIDIEEVDVWGSESEFVEEHLPCSGATHPPRPLNLPPYSLSNGSESSSANTFALSKPLRLLGKRTSQSGGAILPVNNKPTIDEDDFQNTEGKGGTNSRSHATHTSNTSSIQTSSIMSPSEVNVIRDYYRPNDENSQIFSLESDEKSSKTVVNATQFDLKLMPEWDENLENEDYEESVAHSAMYSGSELNNNVWTEVVSESTVSESEGSSTTCHDHEHTDAVDRHEGVDNRSRVKKSSQSADQQVISIDQASQTYSSSLSASISSRSSERGEVDTGFVNTVAYFNL